MPIWPTPSAQRIGHVAAASRGERRERQAARATTRTCDAQVAGIIDTSRAVARDDDHRGERARHDERQHDGGRARVERAGGHQHDAGTREDQRDPGPAVDGSAENTQPSSAAIIGRDRLHEEHVRDGRVVQGEQERARRDREEHGERKARRPMRRNAPRVPHALRQQRRGGASASGRKRRTSGDLRRGVRVEPALRSPAVDHATLPRGSRAVPRGPGAAPGPRNPSRPQSTTGPFGRPSAGIPAACMCSRNETHLSAGSSPATRGNASSDG